MLRGSGQVTYTIHAAWHSRCTWGAMLHYAIIFFVIALIAAVLGFGGVTGVAMEVGRILCILFVILAVISLFRGRTPRA